MKEGFKGLYMIIPIKAHTKLKKMAVKKKLSMTEIVLEWIKDE